MRKLPKECQANTDEEKALNIGGMGAVLKRSKSCGWKGDAEANHSCGDCQNT
jgi:hypothetical protein